MTSLAPGTYVTFNTAPPSPNGAAQTGVWFVTGETQQGPVGTPVPITSMQDYLTYLGERVTYGFLYDSLDEFFHDGGVQAYVSRIVGPGASTAHATLQDQGGSPQNTLTIQTVGAGSWGNNVTVTVATGTVSNSYTIQVANNGTTVATSPNLFTPADAVNWCAAQSPWLVLVTIANAGSTNSAPTNNPANGTFTLTGGTDDTAGITETQWTNALAAFTDAYGPGQVSAPGHTTTAGYEALLTHAADFNRVALLDVADSSSASTLIGQAQAAQASVTDPSYGAMFAPWVVIPGITSSNPGTSSPVLTRTIPPSAVAAALMARNDQNNDANVPAAGVQNGSSLYAIGVTQQYTTANAGLLNAAGVDLFTPFFGIPVIALMGYRSLATDPNWVYLNNVRFRMQATADFDNIGNNYLFSEIDGQGQLFAKFNGDLAGRCTKYWQNGSLYGQTAAAAFQVNTGPQVNTNKTIAAGQLNAQVLLRMSPLAEFVNITVTKYLASASLPVTTPANGVPTS